MRNRWHGVLVALIVIAFGFAGFPALAQQTGDIDGTVVDSNNSPMPGVSIEIKSPALQGARNTVTDAAGRYRFPVVPPGTYTLTASLSGFTKVERTGVRVGLGATASVQITLRVSVQEEVVVTGEAPAVDTTKSTVGMSATSDTIQKLPLGRNFVSVATTVAGTGTSAGGGLTVYGATGLENQYIIDGVNTTGIKIGDQGKVLNNEFVQEVEIKTGGYEAEYSRALGGVINVVTKSGGNEYHGDLFGYYDNENVSASDKNADARNDVGLGERRVPRRLDIGADVGGYVMKDRIWFFGAFDHVRKDSRIEAAYSYTIGSTPKTSFVNFRDEDGKTRSNLFSGKLTFRLGESNTVAVTAFGDPYEYEGPLYTTIIGPESARLGKNTQGGTDYSAKWDGVFGSQFLAQVQWGYHSEKYWDEPASTSLAIREQRAGYLRYYVDGSGIPFYSQEKYNRNAFKVSGTAFVGTMEIKGGIDYEAINSQFHEDYGGGALATNRLRTGDGAYQFTAYPYFANFPLDCLSRHTALDTPDDQIETGHFGTPGAQNPLVPTIYHCLGYAQGGGVVNEPKTRNLGFFLQDSWKIMSNLTVNAGIRYDAQTLKDATGEDRIKLTNEWSPRIGVVWDFMNNGKSKVYANYGRYYTVIPQDIQTRALGNEYSAYAYNTTRAVPGGAVDPIQDPDVSASYAYIQGGQVTADGLKGMYQDEIIAGVEYEVLKNWSLGVKGIYKSLGRTVEDRCDVYDRRLPELAKYAEGTLTSCALINPGESGELGVLKDPTNPDCQGPDGNALTLDGNCESTRVTRVYRGLELTATHRFSSNFYVMASYVYSKLVGNYDGNEKQSTGQQDPNINADFDYIDLIPNNWGRLSLDRTHQAKLSGNYSFPFGLTVGLSARYSSGAPFTVMGFARGNYPEERFLTAGRGEMGNQPSNYEADIHLEYSLRLGPVTISPIIDVFNALNRQGATEKDVVFNNVSPAANNPANQKYVPAHGSIPARGNPGCGETDGTVPAAPIGYDNAACATNATYMKPIAWQDARQIRIGARISF
jgi:hypothetical protein